MARSGVGVAARQVRCGSRVVTFVVADPPSFDAALRPSPGAVRELEAREDVVRVDEVCGSSRRLGAGFGAVVFVEACEAWPRVVSTFKPEEVVLTASQGDGELSVGRWRRETDPVI